MYGSVQTALTRNKSKWQNYEPFVESTEEFDAIVAVIFRIAPKQLRSIGGAAEKRAALKALGEVAWLIAAQVSAYAAKTSNVKLQSRVAFSKTVLITGGDQAVLTRCRTVHSAATENLSNLTKYKIDAERLEKLDKAIEHFQTLTTAPRDITNQSVSVTKQLAALFKKADKVLNDQLDMLVTDFEESDPSFHGEYTSARIIVDARGGESKTAPDPTPAPPPQDKATGV